MDLIEAVRSLNRKAVQEDWQHVCDPTLAFEDAQSQNFLALWREKAGGRAMPRRSDMTPRDLKNVLPNLVVFERVSENPSRYRWRLVGTAVTKVAGHENTGKTFEETVPPQHMERWVSCCDLVLDGGQPLRFLGRVHLQERSYLHAENLFVPLANDNDVPSFVMGLCRYTPRYTESEDVWENQLASLPGGLL
jgi:hypothetical protein